MICDNHTLFLLLFAHSGLKFKNILNYLPYFKSNQFRLNMAEIQNGAVQNVAEVANAGVGLNAPAAANANVAAVQNVAEVANAGVGLNAPAAANANVAAVQNVAEVANAGVGSNAPAVAAGKKNNRSGTTNWNSEDHDAILNSISNMGGNWE
jgi:hypothetical protein